MKGKRFRQKVIWFLHTRPVLVFISVLVVIECLSIIGQMWVELQALKIKYQDRQIWNKKLIDVLAQRFTNFSRKFPNNEPLALDTILNRLKPVYSASCKHSNFNFSSDSQFYPSSLATLVNSSALYGSPDCQKTFISFLYEKDGVHFLVETVDANSMETSNPENENTIDEIGQGSLGQENDLKIAEEVLEIIGFVILAIMLVEVSLRTVCRGRYFYRHKFELLDTIIVYLDAVFASKTTWATEDDDSSTIVILLLPWRIVRIVYSMISTINSRHTIRMRIMKTKKKELEEKLTKAKSAFHQMEKDIDMLEKLCLRKGATNAEIEACFCSTTSKITMGVINTIASFLRIDTNNIVPRCSRHRYGDVAEIFGIGTVHESVNKDNNQNNNMPGNSDDDNMSVSSSDNDSVEEKYEALLFSTPASFFSFRSGKSSIFGRLDASTSRRSRPKTKMTTPTNSSRAFKNASGYLYRTPLSFRDEKEFSINNVTFYTPGTISQKTFDETASHPRKICTDGDAENAKVGRTRLTSDICIPLGFSFSSEHTIEIGNDPRNVPNEARTPIAVVSSQDKNSAVNTPTLENLMPKAKNSQIYCTPL